MANAVAHGISAFEGFHWHIEPDYRDLLLGPDGCRLAEWLSAGLAHGVKKAMHRTVYRIELPNGGFYVKHYPVHDAAGRLRTFLRPSKALGEFRKAREVARRGIATFTPVAVGERGGECILISRTLENAVPLDTFLLHDLPAMERTAQSEMRKRVAKSLARFVARLHAVGIRHDDFHPGNLLIRNTDSEPEFFLIDLHAVRFRSVLSWSACRDNLAMLNNWFAVRAQRTDRLRFWNAYCQAQNVGVEQGTSALGTAIFRAGEARRIEEQAWQSIGEIWQARDRRCLANNRYYAVLSPRPGTPGRGVGGEGPEAAQDGLLPPRGVLPLAPGPSPRNTGARGEAVGHAVAGLDADLVRTLLADPEEPFRRPGIRILKNSRSSSVIEFVLPSPLGGEGPGVRGARLSNAGPLTPNPSPPRGEGSEGKSRRLIYKRFSIVSAFEPVLNRLRRSKALRSWYFGQCLHDRFLPTPRPLLVVHRRRFGLNHEGYLLTEKVEDAVHLHDFLASIAQLPKPAQRDLICDCIEQTARMIREMHRHNFSHRDLKACNILVQRPSEGGRIKVWLIDLVGVEKHGKLPWRRRIRDLARLHASFHDCAQIRNGDKLRFLRIYLQCGLFGSRNWKLVWQLLHKATLAKIARNRRIGRPLA